LIAVLLVACSGDPLDVDFGDGPPIRTDASAYIVTQREGLLEVSIPFSFENRLPQTIYLQRCGGILLTILERKVGAEWETEWNAFERCPTSDPRTLSAGVLYVDTVRIHAHPFGDEREPQFRSQEVTGTHRLRWSVFRSFDATRIPPGDQLPLRHRISNEFQLQGP
jgi:hypothetical protein